MHLVRGEHLASTWLNHIGIIYNWAFIGEKLSNGTKVLTLADMGIALLTASISSSAHLLYRLALIDLVCRVGALVSKIKGCDHRYAVRYWNDRTKSRRGRRKPYMLLGALPLV